MKRVSEVKEYFNKNKPSKIIFMSENQDDPDFADPIVLSLTFSSIIIGQNPNVVYMTDGNNSLRINMVSGFNIREDPTAIGAEVDIVCRCNGKERTYTLLVA